jgi:hypothetical protein
MFNMVEAFIILRLIMAIALFSSIGFGVAAMVSYTKYFNDKLAKIFIITAAVLFVIGLLAVIPICIIYTSFELQFLEHIGI